MRVNEIPGHDHNYCGIASTINASAWEFLKQVELSGDPKYSQFGIKQDTARANQVNRRDQFALTRKARELVDSAEAKDKGIRSGRTLCKDRAQLNAIAQEQARPLQRGRGHMAERGAEMRGARQQL